MALACNVNRDRERDRERVEIEIEWEFNYETNRCAYDRQKFRLLGLKGEDFVTVSFKCCVQGSLHNGMYYVIDL